MASLLPSVYSHSDSQSQNIIFLVLLLLQEEWPIPEPKEGGRFTSQKRLLQIYV